MTLRWAGALIAALAASAALAQDITAERAALAQAQAAGRKAAERAAQLEREAAAAGDAAARLRSNAASIAARIQSAEADIDAAEARIDVIERLRADQRARLAVRQGPTIRLIAALQTMTRRPPALALVQPGSFTTMVHVRAVMGTVLPAVRARTADLRAEVERGRQLRASANAALDERRNGQQRLVTQRQRLAALEVQRRQAAMALSGSAMVEQDRAIAMGEEARDIVDLMGRIGDAASVRAQLETLPGPMLRPQTLDTDRPLPAEVAAVETHIPAYRLPVVGRVVTGLGEVSEAGVRARGLTLATRPNAIAVAPTSGRIAYASAFRGYGRIVVIDHGRGWTTLITNLAALDVKVGDMVERGSPIGRAGSDRPLVTVELRRQGRPVDIARLAG